MLKTEPSSLLGRYVKQVRDWGFNFMAIFGDPEKGMKLCLYLDLYC